MTFCKAWQLPGGHPSGNYKRRMLRRKAKPHHAFQFHDYGKSNDNADSSSRKQNL